MERRLKRSQPCRGGLRRQMHLEPCMASQVRGANGPRTFLSAATSEWPAGIGWLNTKTLRPAACGMRPSADPGHLPERQRW